MGTVIGGQRTDKGLALIATAPYAYSDTDRSRFLGALYTIPAGTVQAFDLRMDAEIRLHGGHYWARGAAAGDVMAFHVVDVDNVLGTGPGAVISTYIESLPVAPWDHERNLTSPTAALIPAGLYLRVHYTSTGAAPVTLGVTYQYFLQTAE